MISGYLENVNIDGAVHPVINTNKAKTGRESTEVIVNVSKEVKAGARYTVPARRCFRPRPKKFILLGDYAGIEMRLGVQGTNSPRLFELCKKDFDFHSAMAASFYGDAFLNEVDKAIKKGMRNRAKNARFAMFYGAGVKQTAKTLGLSIDEVLVGYAKDKEEYPEFYTFMAECARKAERHGYIETFFGRKLRVERGRYYTATDYRIQGSAADIFKSAQIKLDDWLQREFGDEHVRMILPVHDEMVMEFDNQYLVHIDGICKKINKIMTVFPEITVNLNMEFSISLKTWADKKEVIIK
jgi:DNA polymerase-1